jgi:predicted ArsR family transcriptional regulator
MLIYPSVNLISIKMVMAIGDGNSSNTEIDVRVFRACILGNSLGRIAKKIGISERTVKESLERLVKAGLVSQRRKRRY